MPKYEVYGYTKTKWRCEVEAENADEAEEIARDNWESSNWLDGDIEVVDVEELKENQDEH